MLGVAGGAEERHGELRRTHTVQRDGGRIGEVQRDHAGAAADHALHAAQVRERRRNGDRLQRAFNHQRQFVHRLHAASQRSGQRDARDTVVRSDHVEQAVRLRVGVRQQHRGAGRAQLHDAVAHPFHEARAEARQCGEATVAHRILEFLQRLDAKARMHALNRGRAQPGHAQHFLQAFGRLLAQVVEQARVTVGEQLVEHGAHGRRERTVSQCLGE